MRILSLTLMLSFGLLIACSGGEKAAGENDSQNSAAGTDIDDNSKNPDEPTPPDTPTPPTGPVITATPGDLVQTSQGSPNAIYPPTTDPVIIATNYQAEPKSDTNAPIIAIQSYPNTYVATPNNNTIQLWAADDVGGSGLKKIECSIDEGVFADCGTQVSMTGLSEGVHLLEARSVDWDGNQSTEVSYAFYVDTTGPTVDITKKPAATTSLTNANFIFTGQDSGSGFSHFLCKLDTATLSKCNASVNLSNLSEGTHSMHLVAVDKVGNSTSYGSYKWVVDYSAPVINFTTQPLAQVYTQTTQTVVFTVLDSYNPTGINVSCQLNGVATNCSPSTALKFPAPNPASFTFSVTATDMAGNSSTSSISWIAVDIAENRTTTVTVDQDRPVDILFIVDNSGSMNYERSNLAQRIDGMINKLAGLNWQIAITSTDSTNNNAYSDGRLIEMIGLPGEYILDSTMNVNIAQTLFGDTIQNFPNGSGNEEGIYSAKRVIDRYLAGDANNINFIRDGADLSIVILSDEDEASTGASTRISPQGFVDFVDTTFNGTKNMVFHSIITIPGDQACLNGEGEYYGNEYDALSRLTGYGQAGGAIIGSVCDMDYSSQLASIGQSVKDLQNSIQLQCPPFDANNDGIPEVTVYYRPNASSTYTAYNGAKTYNNDRLIFTTLLPPGDYKVDYQCRIN